MARINRNSNPKPAITRATAAPGMKACEAGLARPRRPDGKAASRCEADLPAGAASFPVKASPVAEAVAPAAARVSRTGQLVEALRTPNGASIEDLCERFGWLPHSARAALTGLRKRGLDVRRAKRDSVTVYRIPLA